MNIFLADTVWNEGSDYRRLLLANYLFLNNRLAEFYGIGTNAADEFVKVTLDAKEGLAGLPPVRFLKDRAAGAA